jgi:uncharacterized membrane-anchored protein
MDALPNNGREQLPTRSRPASTPTPGLVGDTRALNTTPTYWFSMFAASALGTNIGDFRVDDLSLDRWASFASLVTIAVIAILGDRFVWRRPAACYWIAIVVLRAAATNVADLLTHDLKLGYLVPSIILALATLLGGYFTRPDQVQLTSPTIDSRYWGTMLLAGIFGTTAGDMASHTFGLYTAAGLLCLTLVIVIGLRREFAPASITAYWCIVLAERCAGTPVGDGLASGRAAGLGLPLAIACTGTLLAAGLLAHALTHTERGV